VPLGAVPALSWCGEVSLGGIRFQLVILSRSQQHHIATYRTELISRFVNNLRCPMRLSDSTSSFLLKKRRNSESKLAQVPEQGEFTIAIN